MEFKRSYRYREFCSSTRTKKAGIRTPRVFLATSEVLIQQQIQGLTLAEIIDQYDVLKQLGRLDVNDEIINGIWDFLDNVFPLIKEKAENVITKIKGSYWSAYFNDFDINWGNVMIPLDSFSKPEQSYYLIDPLV